MAMLNYNWQNIASISVSRGQATVNFYIDAKLNRQDTNNNYSVIDTRLNSTIVNNLSGSGYKFELTGSNGISGSSIWYFGNETILTGQYTVYHNNEGYGSSTASAHVYNKYWSIDQWFSSYFDLPKIDRYPVLINGSNFTDETNPTLNFNSYGTFPIKVKLEVSSNNHLIERNLTDKNAKSYTIELTDEERDILRALTPNSNELIVRETVCAMSGNTELSSSYKDYKMTIVNANPIFTNFNFKDIRSKTVELTGDNQSIITGQSNIQILVSTSDKAIAQKKATMSKYRFTIGDNNSKDADYSSDNNVSKTLNNVTSGVINTYAIDSRNNSTLVTKQVNNIIQYNNIVKGDINATRSDGGIGELVKLTYNGTFDNINFGSKTNTIKSATYQITNLTTNILKLGVTNILPIINGNNYSFEGYIAGDNEEASFNISDSYLIEVIVEDELSSVKYTFTLGAGIPNIAFHKNGVGIMGKYDENEGGLLQIAGKRIDYNLIIDGPPVRTGRKINDKWEYIKAFSIDIGDSQGLYEKDSGLILSNIIVLLFNGSITSQLGNVYSLDTVNFNGGYNYLRMHKENNKIGVYTQSENYNNSKAYIEIQYIEK